MSLAMTWMSAKSGIGQPFFISQSVLGRIVFMCFDWHVLYSRMQAVLRPLCLLCHRRVFSAIKMWKSLSSGVYFVETKYSHQGTKVLTFRILGFGGSSAVITDSVSSVSFSSPPPSMENEIGGSFSELSNQLYGTFFQVPLKSVVPAADLVIFVEGGGVWSIISSSLDSSPTFATCHQKK